MNPLEDQEAKEFIDFLKSTDLNGMTRNSFIQRDGVCSVCGKEVVSKHVIDQPFKHNTMVQYYSPICAEHIIILNIHEVDNRPDDIWTKGCFEFGMRKRA